MIDIDAGTFVASDESKPHEPVNYDLVAIARFLRENNMKFEDLTEDQLESFSTL